MQPSALSIFPPSGAGEKGIALPFFGLWAVTGPLPIKGKEDAQLYVGRGGLPSSVVVADHLLRKKRCLLGRELRVASAMFITVR